jgi:hypothetical protein
MSAYDGKLDKNRITELFNLGFRRGANDRAGMGVTYAHKPGEPVRQAPEPPAPPPDLSTTERKAWESGYGMGYQLGASDADLASVEVPGACGMISGLGPDILDMMGLFKTEESIPK